jgi:hypothetical protein
MPELSRFVRIKFVSDRMTAEGTSSKTDLPAINQIPIDAVVGG